MSRNIIVNGIVYPNVPSVVLVDEQGNDIQYDFTDELTFFGENTELLRTVWSDERMLSDFSSWGGWLPSTSVPSVTLDSRSNNIGTETLDLAAYDYMVEIAFKVSYAYNSGTTLRNCPRMQFGRFYYQAIGNVERIGGTTLKGEVVTLNDSSTAMVYYTTTDNDNVSWGAVAGIVFKPEIYDDGEDAWSDVPTVSSSGVLTIKKPRLIAQIGTNFAASVKSTISAAETTVSRKINLYRIKAHKSIDSKIYQRSLDLIENDL